MTDNGRVEFTHSGKEVVHGRASSYNNHGCRCSECRAAWSKYMAPRIKAYRENKKKKQQGVSINI